MYQTIPAVFEEGIFRPLKKIHLKQHQKILLKIELSKEDYDSLVETLEILNDKEQLKRIRSALQSVKRGEIFSHKDVFGHLQPNV